MDSILSNIMLILGKYRPDDGIALGQEVSPKALAAAREIVSLSLAQLRQTPKGDVLATGFEQDPQTYERPIEIELNAALQTDPNFAARLQLSLALYEQALNQVNH
jgi:hypothetical protein